MNNDRLAWWEEIPLGLALLAQSYVVGLWYYASIDGAAWLLDLLVAVLAGLALDLIVVTTVMGRRAGRSSGWSWATSLGAFVCSSLIALDRYGWEWRSGLHIAFPLVVFLYSQHLATPRKQSVSAQPATAQVPLETLPERSSLSESPEVDSVAPSTPSATEQAILEELFNLPLEALALTAREPSAPLATAQPIEEEPSGAKRVLEIPVFDRLEDLQQDLVRRMAEAEHPGVPLEQITVVEQPVYLCPHCQAVLKSKQALGAAVKNGYCLACKVERLAAA